MQPGEPLSKREILAAFKDHKMSEGYAANLLEMDIVDVRKAVQKMCSVDGCSAATDCVCYLCEQKFCREHVNTTESGEWACESCCRLYGV